MTRRAYRLERIRRFGCYEAESDAGFLLSEVDRLRMELVAARNGHRENCSVNLEYPEACDCEFTLRIDRALAGE